MGVNSCVVFSLFFLTIVSCIDSYRILGIFPFNGKSHNVMFNGLMRGLAERGHQVDHVTHFPIDNPPPTYNVTVNLHGTLPQMVNSFTIKFALDISGDAPFFIAGKYGNGVCELMGLDSIQKLVKDPPKNPPYDLVIAEVFGANCYLGFGHHLNVPIIALSSAPEYPWVSEMIGNADNLAVSGNALIKGFDRKNFWDRLNNVITYYQSLRTFYTISAKQTEMMRKYLNPNMPDIREVERNIALTIVNRHPLISGVKPLTSSLIEVSGLHIEKNGPTLSPELKKWLDESPQGVVYFTFGSLVLIETLPESTIKDLYESFSKIPLRVLMKIADKRKLPPGLPKNVLTSSWIPQQAVLAHKNVRVFITHGGLMGCQEALHFGVPLIGVPLFGDQPINIQAFVEKNMAIKIDFTNLTTDSLDWALNEVLTNNKYSKNAKLYSKLFRDRPLDAMDTAVYWTEYVIRTQGASILKSGAHDLYWWQIALLDVYGFILFCIILALSVVYYSIKLILRIFISKSSIKKKTQ